MRRPVSRATAAMAASAAKSKSRLQPTTAASRASGVGDLHAALHQRLDQAGLSQDVHPLPRLEQRRGHPGRGDEVVGLGLDPDPGQAGDELLGGGRRVVGGEHHPRAPVPERRRPPRRRRRWARRPATAPRRGRRSSTCASATAAGVGVIPGAGSVASGSDATLVPFRRRVAAASWSADSSARVMSPARADSSSLRRQARVRRRRRRHRRRPSTTSVTSAASADGGRARRQVGDPLAGDLGRPLPVGAEHADVEGAVPDPGLVEQAGRGVLQVTDDVQRGQAPSAGTRSGPTPTSGSPGGPRPAGSGGCCATPRRR